jgi:predicted RNA-binding Zn-ribbon protein involved in translation (DUF1610 family)
LEDGVSPPDIKLRGSTVTEEDETLPVSCPKCHQATRKPVSWVQENTFYTCPGCGTSALIDKDAAMKTLAALYHAAE